MALHDIRGRPRALKFALRAGRLPLATHRFRVMLPARCRAAPWRTVQQERCRANLKLFKGPDLLACAPRGANGARSLHEINRCESCQHLV